MTANAEAQRRFRAARLSEGGMRVSVILSADDARKLRERMAASGKSAQAVIVALVRSSDPL